MIKKIHGRGILVHSDLCMYSKERMALVKKIWVQELEGEGTLTKGFG